ncbi:MAG: phosphoenolpyruvate--protein phosphotransferase [Firmicutes bacterium]|nr:phosphoenolpyruvate--protein phosphotransferase [Bacillota bacterium]
MQYFKGIGVSAGISIAKATVFSINEVQVEHKRLQNPEREWARMENALKECSRQLKEIYQQTLQNIGKNEAEIFDAHISILEDEEFTTSIKRLIIHEQKNAEWAIEEVRDKYIEIFKMMDNSYMQQRVADINDVSQRLLCILKGINKKKITDKKAVIVAHDLTPSDTAQLNKDEVLGFIIEVGGETSHSAIIACSLGIPAVAGVKNILEKIKTDDQLIIDGGRGDIYLNPEQQIIEKYQQKQKAYLLEQQEYQKLKGKLSITRDGYRVKIAGNIGLLTDVDSILENDAEGIGLFRTEFLYMERSDFPTEGEQFAVYQAAAQKMKGRPVIIRTLDIGGDKALPYFKLPQESNPFLGFRAIRFCLERTDLFKTQLRAILRASNYGNIKIMFPMISTVKELFSARFLLDEARDELQAEGIPFAEDLEVGMMMETPAAAVISDKFAKLVDFFSIGTNDLIQYTTVVDRMNSKVAKLYSPFNPSVLRLIKQIIENAHKNNIWVGICGEAASIPALIPYFVALGVDELSMSSGSILKTKWIIQQLIIEDMEKLIEKVDELDSPKEIKELLEGNFTSKASYCE